MTNETLLALALAAIDSEDARVVLADAIAGDRVEVSAGLERLVEARRRRDVGMAASHRRGASVHGVADVVAAGGEVPA